MKLMGIATEYNNESYSEGSDQDELAQDYIWFTIHKDGDEPIRTKEQYIKSMLESWKILWQKTIGARIIIDRYQSYKRKIKTMGLSNRRNTKYMEEIAYSRQKTNELT